jgi:D-alanyl-D-alanine carboxypeptidase
MPAMLKLSSFCFAALILFQPAAAMAADDALAARIDSALQKHYKPDGPGATVLVVKDGQPLFRKAYGMADIAKGLAMNADMSLRLGSITKQFTAVSILMLAEEGKLAVSDEITKFLPDYPTQGKKITIEHLLTHTSGIVSYTGKREFRAIMTKDMSVADMIDFFKSDPMEFEPGSRWAYDNSGYFLLGAIIEKVSGLPYARFVETRIFVPLGMTQSAYEGYERSPVSRAVGYSRGVLGFSPSPPLSMTQPYAAGALVSTVDDLARWDAAITSGKLLKPASWARAFTPYTLSTGAATNYGYGWGIGKMLGKPMISHGGGINGFSTFALRIPDDKLFIAVLSNADSGLYPSESVASQVAAIVMGKPFPEFKAVKLDAKALDAFTGEYKIDDKNTRTIKRDDDHLVIVRPGRPDTPLLAYSDTGFYVENVLMYLEFARDAKGAVTQVTVHQGGSEFVNPRVSAAPQ